MLDQAAADVLLMSSRVDGGLGKERLKGFGLCRLGIPSERRVCTVGSLLRGSSCYAGAKFWVYLGLRISGLG